MMTNEKEKKAEPVNMISRLCKIGDLEYIDQPYISLYEDSTTKKPYVGMWIDEDEYDEKWIVFQTTKLNVSLYLNGERTMRDLFMGRKTKGIMMVTLSNGRYKQLALTSELSSEYIPNTDSFFKRNYCLNYNTILKYLMNGSSISKPTGRKHKLTKAYT